MPSVVTSCQMFNQIVVNHEGAVSMAQRTWTIAVERTNSKIRRKPSFPSQRSMVRVIKDRRGQIVEDVEAIRPPRDGEDVALSIDGKIQYLAWSALRDAMQQHKAQAGAVVVLDARSGEVLKTEFKGKRN